MPVLTAPAPTGHRSLYVPGAGQIELWWEDVRLDDADLARLRADVDDATVARAARMARAADRCRTLVAHSLMRRAAARATGADPARLRLQRRCASCDAADHGRPSLVDDVAGTPVPDVSVAHAGDLAVVVTGPAGLRVGVDIEPVAEHRRPGGPEVHRSALADACHRFMAPAERLAAAGAADPDAAYLRAWTGKEAVAKAVGSGLGDHLVDVDVLGARPVADRWFRLRHPAALVAFPVLPAPATGDPDGYQAAVAVLDAPARLVRAG